MAIALTASSVMCPPARTEAAKKPSINKKKATITVNDTVKVSIKNGNKKARVTWKSSKPKIARITKKTVKGNNAYAVIKGIKKGKSVITASYKINGKANKLSCKVTVVSGKSNPAVPTPTQGIPSNQIIPPGGNSQGENIPAVNPTSGQAGIETKVPDEKPTTDPGEKPTTDPGEKPTTDPGEKPTTDPGEKPTTDPGEKPTTDPGEKPTTDPGEKPTTDPGEKPTTDPGEKPTTDPGEKPSASPGIKLLNVKAYLRGNLSMVEVGETSELIVECQPSDVKIDTIEYSLKDESDSQYVSLNGSTGDINKAELTGIRNGNFAVDVKVTDSEGTNISRTLDLSVGTRVTDLNVPETSVELNKGETFCLGASVIPETASDKKVTYSSSDDSIATVNEAGQVTAVSEGNAVISMTAGEGSIRKTCRVQVNGNEVREVHSVSALLELLAEGKAGTIVLSTSSDASMVIPAGNYPDVILEVNAPNAHIENYAVFKKINVIAVSGDTFVEKAVGNYIDVMGESVKVVVESNASCNLAVSGGGSNLRLVNNGTVGSITLLGKSRVDITGESGNTINVEASVLAEKSEIVTDRHLKVNARTQIGINLLEGAQDTEVSVDSRQNMPEVKGVGCVSVYIEKEAEELCVIGDNERSNVNDRKLTVTGSIRDIQGESPAGVKVWLIPYRSAINEGNIHVYAGNTSVPVIEVSGGQYSFKDVTAGNYILYVMKEGYKKSLETLIVTGQGTDNGVYNAGTTRIIPDSVTQKADMAGELKDDTDGSALPSGITIRIRPGRNNRSGEYLQETYTDRNGGYMFRNLEPGWYTIQVLDNRGSADIQHAYEETYISRAVGTDGDTATNRNTIARKSRQVRFVLSWNGRAAMNLDSHLTGPSATGNGEFHTWFGEPGYSAYEEGKLRNVRYAALDTNVTDGRGAETTTVYSETSGEYKFYVHNYSDIPGGSMLAGSGATVSVYVDGVLKKTYKASELFTGSQKGNLWHVCTYSGGTLTDGAGISSHEADAGAVGVSPLVYRKGVLTDAVKDAYDMLDRLTDDTSKDYTDFERTVSEAESMLDGSFGNVTVAEIDAETAKLRGCIQQIKDSVRVKGVNGNGIYSCKLYNGSILMLVKEVNTNFIPLIPQGSTYTIAASGVAGYDYRITVTGKAGYTYIYLVNMERDPVSRFGITGIQSETDKMLTYSIEYAGSGDNVTGYVSMSGYSCGFPDDLNLTFVSGSMPGYVCGRSDVAGYDWKYTVTYGNEQITYYMGYTTRDNALDIISVNDPDARLSYWTVYGMQTTDTADGTVNELYAEGYGEELSENLTVTTIAESNGFAPDKAVSVSDMPGYDGKITYTYGNMTYTYYVRYYQKGSSLYADGLTDPDNYLVEVEFDYGNDSIHVTGLMPELGSRRTLNVPKDVSCDFAPDNSYVTLKKGSETKRYYITYTQNSSVLKLKGISYADSGIITDFYCRTNRQTGRMETVLYAKAGELDCSKTEITMADARLSAELEENAGGGYRIVIACDGRNLPGEYCYDVVLIPDDSELRVDGVDVRAGSGNELSSVDIYNDTRTIVLKGRYALPGDSLTFTVPAGTTQSGLVADGDAYVLTISTGTGELSKKYRVYYTQDETFFALGSLANGTESIPYDISYGYVTDDNSGRKTYEGQVYVWGSSAVSELDLRAEAGSGSNVTVEKCPSYTDAGTPAYTITVTNGDTSFVYRVYYIRTVEVEPEPAPTQEPAPTLKPTMAPVPTATVRPSPEPTRTPAPTATPKPSPEPTRTPKPERTAEPTVTPGTETTAKPDKTAEPTVTPGTETTAKPDKTAKPSATPKPSPKPTPAPALPTPTPIPDELKNKDDMDNLREFISEQHSNGAYNVDDDIDSYHYVWDHDTGRLININNMYGLKGSVSFSKFTALESISISDSIEMTSFDISGNINLKELNCWNNALTKLDLSKNTKLERLDCSGNQLVTLDISNNPELVELQCSVNRLTEIITGDNSKLSGIDCSSNQFRELEFAGDIKLEWLHCYNNPLTELDVSSMPELLILNCSRCELTKLNVSNNDKLWDLNCAGNKLTKLDISKNVLLSLVCTHNMLTELDVRGQVNLERLDCSDNRLSELDISSNVLLYSVNCSKNQLDALDIGSIADLKYLNCSGNRITALNTAANTELNGLNCSDNMLTSLDISGNVLLYEIDCSKNQLDVLNIESITGLYSLNCSDNQLREINVSANTFMRTLDCSNNYISALDISKNTEWLSTLNCSGNRLTELDISRNYKLSTLDCSDNQLTELDISCRWMYTLNCSGNRLTRLDVSDQNEIYSLECANNQLAELNVSNNKELRILDCSDNQISKLDLSRNTMLKTLRCSGNQISKLDLSAQNQSLEELSYDEDVYIIAYPSLNTPEPLTVPDELKNKDDVDAIKALIAEQKSRGAYVSDNLDYVYQYIWNPETGRLTSINWSCRYLSGSVSFAGLPALETINCSENIEMTGIDVTGNPELIHLECQNNAISSLDVGSNPHLAYLNCHGNELEELNVSNNPDLEELYCQSNKLTSLNVGGNSRLRKLYCGYNKLSALNVSGNPDLSWLDCCDNQLSGINVKNNAKLLRLNCGSNTIKSLNVSENNKLMVLDCSRNQMEQLNISSTARLFEFICHDNKLDTLDVSNYENLLILNCSQNQLSSLDVSNNTELTDLYCYSNQLATLDISNNSGLINLNCGENLLSALDISNNTELNDLSCYNNNLTSLDISGNINLRTVYCGNNRITEIDVSNNYYLENLGCDYGVNIISTNRVNEVTADLSKATGDVDGYLSYDSSTGELTVNDERPEVGAYPTIVFVPIDMVIAPEEQVKVVIKGPSWGNTNLRGWTTPKDQCDSGDYVADNMAFFEAKRAGTDEEAREGEPFVAELTMEAVGRLCQNITLKPNLGINVTGLVISEITVTRLNNKYPVFTPVPTMPSIIPTPKPTRPPYNTANPMATADVTAEKTDKSICIDGIIDEAWDSAEYLPIDRYIGTKGDTEAGAKIMWDANYLYVLVDVKDDDIDATSEYSYCRDGADIYLDEDNSGENSYSSNTDAFQYSFTGLSSNGSDAMTMEFVSASNDARSMYRNINSAYGITKDGYAIEYRIPWAWQAEANQVVGFEINVYDCSGGKRNSEIFLTDSSDPSRVWNDPSAVGKLKLVDNKPISMDLANVRAENYGNSANIIHNGDGSVTIDWTGTDNWSGVVFSFDEPKNLSEYSNIEIDIEGRGDTYSLCILDAVKKDSYGGLASVGLSYGEELPCNVRLDSIRNEDYNGSDEGGTDGDYTNVKGVKLLKGVGDYAPITITAIRFLKDTTVTPAATATPVPEPTLIPTAAPGSYHLDLGTLKVTDGSVTTYNADGTVSIECNGNYTGGISIAIPDDIASSAAKIIVAVEASEGGGQVVFNVEGESEAPVKYNWDDNNKSNYNDTTYECTGKPLNIVINNQSTGNIFTIRYIEIVGKESSQPTWAPAPTATPVPVPTVKPGSSRLDLGTLRITDGSVRTDNADGTVTIECNGNYTGGISIAIPDDIASSAAKIIVAVEASEGGGQVVFNVEGESEAPVKYNWDDKDKGNYNDTTYECTGKPLSIIINNQNAGNIFIIKYIEIAAKESSQPTWAPLQPTATPVQPTATPLQPTATPAPTPNLTGTAYYTYDGADIRTAAGIDTAALESPAPNAPLWQKTKKMNFVDTSYWTDVYEDNGDSGIVFSHAGTSLWNPIMSCSAGYPEKAELFTTVLGAGKEDIPENYEWSAKTENTGRVIWDENYMYVLFDISDTDISPAVDENDYITDSTELYFDENDSRSVYTEDDTSSPVMLRVGVVDNRFSSNDTSTGMYPLVAHAVRYKLKDGTTTDSITDGDGNIRSEYEGNIAGYQVEYILEFTRAHSNGDVVGMDLHVNDCFTEIYEEDQNGILVEKVRANRACRATVYDTFNYNYASSVNYGHITLVNKDAL